MNLLIWNNWFRNKKRWAHNNHIYIYIYGNYLEKKKTKWGGSDYQKPRNQLVLKHPFNQQQKKYKNSFSYK